MKKILTAILVTISLSCFSQSKKDSTFLKDSVPIISISDINATLNFLADKSSHSDFLKIEAAFRWVLKYVDDKKKKK